MLRDLKTYNTTAAISIFQLPPDAIEICKGGAEWEPNGGGKWEPNGGGTPAYFVEMKEPPYCVGPYKLGNREYTKDHLEGVQYWIRVDDAMLITSDGLLSVLAPILLPQEIIPTEQKVASRLLSVVLKQRNKKRDNWSKFLRLRGAWNDQDEAKGWVDDNHMLDFTWNDVKNPTRFGVDFGQSMEPSEVRKEQMEAKYWWVDIPDLTGLVLSVLPYLQRKREKELRGGKSKEKVLREGNAADWDKGTLDPNESERSTARRYGVSRKTAKKSRENHDGRLSGYQTPQRQGIDSRREQGGDALKNIAIDSESQGTLMELKESVVEHAPTMWGWTKARAKEWVAQFDDKDELGDAIAEEDKKYTRAQGAGKLDEERL